MGAFRNALHVLYNMCYNICMIYQQEYDKAAAEMKKALQDLQAAEARVLSLQRQMAALHVLMWEGKPEAERTAAEAQMVEVSMKVIGATRRPADQIRRIFARTAGPLTTNELREELRRVGCDLSKQANPSGTIGAVCARLKEQGVIKLVRKDGRKAWERVV